MRTRLGFAWIGALLIMLMIIGSGCVSRPQVIVQAGQPQAEIVVAEAPPRLVTLAAEELRDYVQKLSGAELPIVTAPSESVPVQLYVGHSPHTEALGLRADDLKHGAYRLVAGRGYLAFLGYDADFEPREPYPRHHSQYPETQAAWEELTGSLCLNPMNWYGGPATSYHRATGIWKQDQSGSLQAVYAFLREQGVRWYLPGELGEVVPHQSTLAFTTTDRTVKPDFAMRNLYWYNRFHMAQEDDIRWWLRLGLNDGYSLLGASMQVHGMRMIQSSDKLKEAHPEYYALINGKRETEFRGSGHACFSSPGLQALTVAYIRDVYERYDEPAVDLWPQDAYHQCQCELCAGKHPSDLVFGFVDRVARELYEDYPDRLVTCGAYTSYAAPPPSIDKLSPNVAVYLSNRGRPLFEMPAHWDRYWEEVEGWRAKLAPGRLIRGENNLYNQRLIIHPHAYARDLKALQGISLGDICEVPRGTPGKSQWQNIGINHLNYYIQSRLLWDADQDVDVLLAEYCTTFYGPAAEQMRAAFTYAEDNYNRYRRVLELPQRIEFIEQLTQARELAGDSIYAQRIDLILSELEPLATLKAQLAEELAEQTPREEAPLAVAQHIDSEVEPESYTFKPAVAWRHRETALDLTTSFQLSWSAEALHVRVTCREPELDTLPGAENVWEGDSIMLLLETPYHAHYLIQVAPDGRIFDAKRNAAGRLDPAWTAMAEATTGRDDTGWWVDLTIPLQLIEPDTTFGDPLHYVVAPKPLAGSEWFFNIGRTRVRDGRRTLGEQGYTPFAFSRTPQHIHLLEEFPPRHFARLMFAPPAEAF